MAKINQIENAIKELEGGAFQKLVNSYLLKKGYDKINPIGSVIGNNKTKTGTPDTLLLTGDGKYVFVEITTQEKDFYKKFTKDIEKCLDENKTGIPVTKIREIVLCYTSQLSSANIEKLSVQCAKSGINLNLFSIGTIAYDLLEKYPGIANDYLGITVDTGQIIELESFLTKYDKNKLTTTLRTKFHFRNEEYHSIQNGLEKNNIVIISGKAGIGKSRIAIESFRGFINSNSSYKGYCILNQGTNIFEDVKTYFSDSGDYLILVDDANRISGFQYLLQLFHSKRDNQNFKIIVTVRDYALARIKEQCRPFETISEVSLTLFSNDEIHQLIRSEYKIKNYHYLTRIADIADGNPRIAIMAAKIANKLSSLDSISDVSDLYERYFFSIKDDLKILNDTQVLKVLGIVSFFRTVEKSNKDLERIIEGVFKISKEEFWEQAKKSHEMEIFDMYEDDIVKMSDQVLSTYLFYLVFFKEKQLNFSTLINDLFPQYKQRLIDAINPILNTFGFDNVKAVIKTVVDEAWGGNIKEDDQNLQHLIDVFWYMKPTDILILIQEKVELIEFQKINIDQIKFETEDNSNLPDYLSVLTLIRSCGIDELNISLDLLFQYLEKQQKDTGVVLSVLEGSYGFKPDTYMSGYIEQHTVVDKLITLSNLGKNEFFTRIFIAMANYYLQTHIQSYQNKNRSMVVSNFSLTNNSQITELRNKVLKAIVQFYQKGIHKDIILEMLVSYIESIHRGVGGIIETDSVLLLLFFKDSLDSKNLYHCNIVNKYLALLDRFEIRNTKDLSALFTSNLYKLYNILTDNYRRLDLGLNPRDYRDYQKIQILKLIKRYKKPDFSHIFCEFAELEKVGRENYLIKQGVSLIFETLSEQNTKLYVQVVKDYLKSQDCLDLEPWIVIVNLNRVCGSNKSFKIINDKIYEPKDKWLITYFQCLKKYEIKRKYLKTLLGLYKAANYRYFLNNFDYLLKYENFESGYILKIVEIIIIRAKSDINVANVFYGLFNPFSEINKQMLSVFSSNMPLLEDAYLLMEKVDQDADHDSSTLSRLVDNDTMFVKRYLEDKFLGKKYFNKHDDKRNYSFIWFGNDYLKIIKIIFSTVYNYNQSNRSFGYFESFFNAARNPQTNKEIIERQNLYLTEEISKKHANQEHMHMLFSVIAGFLLKRKVRLYEKFFDCNDNYEDFISLLLEPSISVAWVGSQCDIWYKKVEFFQELHSICSSSLKFLKHKQTLEERIKGLRKQIQIEKRIDFTENSL